MMRMLASTLLSIGCLLVAGAALALEPISVPNGVERAATLADAADASVDCPQLVRIKYPFLSCIADANGNVLIQAADAVALSAREMPRQGDFVESERMYWGRNRGN